MTTSDAPLKQQANWDIAVNKGNRRLALRALHAQLNVELKDHSIDRGGAHDAPCPEGGSPFWDVSNGVYPEDFYSAQGLRYYGTGEDQMDAQVYDKIRALEGCPNKSVVVYRSVPADSPAKKIQPGDWVTPAKAYAKDHGESHINGAYRVMSKTVHARDLFTAGDSMLEWGFHPQERLPELRTGWKDRTISLAQLAEKNIVRALNSSTSPPLFVLAEGAELAQMKSFMGVSDSQIKAIAEKHLQTIQSTPGCVPQQLLDAYASVENLLAEPDGALTMSIPLTDLLACPLVARIAAKTGRDAYHLYDPKTLEKTQAVQLPLIAEQVAEAAKKLEAPKAVAQASVGLDR